MEVRIGLAMVVMLGLVLGSIRANKKSMMRSLVKTRKPRDKTVEDSGNGGYHGKIHDCRWASNKTRVLLETD